MKGCCKDCGHSIEIVNNKRTERYCIYVKTNYFTLKTEDDAWCEGFKTTEEITVDDIYMTTAALLYMVEDLRGRCKELVGWIAREGKDVPLPRRSED